jgi:NitT/TauT family transport system permease protein
VGWYRSAFERILPFAALAVAWEVSVVAFDIKPYLLPRLAVVLESLWTHRVNLFFQSLVTAKEIGLGYLLAVFGGIAIALVIYAWPLAYRMLYPVLVVFQGLPKIALAPLMIIWMGYGTSSKVLMAFLFSVFPVVISTLGGLLGTPHHLLEHFRAIRAGRATTFWRLQLPAALPSIMDGCKTAMPLAVIGAIVGEFVGAQAGLGYMILQRNFNMDMAGVFAILIILSLMGIGLHMLVNAIQRRVVFWMESGADKVIGA